MSQRSTPDFDRAARFLDFTVGPVSLARALLGQRLVRVIRGRRISGLIVETEAYLGARDRAAHSFGNRRTARNDVMYREAGHAYVYFTYGMHHCMNVVCGREGQPVAVLIRALEPTEGLDLMRRTRGGSRPETELCSGPARLCEALRIDLRLNGIDLRSSPALFVERTAKRPIHRNQIGRSPRIGVGYAQDWALRPLRFFVRGSPHVSHARSSPPR